MLEKFAPDKAALLRQKKAENEANLPKEFKQSLDIQKLFDPSSTPEDLVAQLPKLSDFEKSVAYTALSNKIGEVDKVAR